MPNKENWGVVLLAAGNSNRLGRPKQLLEFRGKSLIRRAAETALEVSDKVILVLGSKWERMEQEIDGLPVITVVNQWWEKGMGQSIKTGMEALKQNFPGLEAVVIMLCDQPLITSELLLELVHKKRQSGKKIVACEYEGTRGTPVCFDASLFPALSELEGDQGAKSILKKYAAEMETVKFEGGARDIDTEEDYDLLMSLVKSDFSQ